VFIAGYYDGCASPSPAYYNPIPWQPIGAPPEPKPKSKKKRRRQARNAWSMDN